MFALSRRNDEPERASRPFDKDRDGFVCGEGAGTLILESLTHAQKRGAKIYAEVTGYGVSSDAFHITKPGGGGGRRAMRQALEDAKVNATDIDYINAHATSTPAGDIEESEAIAEVFGAHATDKKVWIGATKSMMGHLLGAAGAAEAAICAEVIRTGRIPPTINLDEPDERCVLDYIAGSARERRVTHALSNSFGFGGNERNSGSLRLQLGTFDTARTSCSARTVGKWRVE